MKIRSFRSVVAGVAALLCAQFAYASDETTRIDAAKSREISVKFATCIVSKRRLKTIAVRFLLQGSRQDGQLIVSSSCFGKTLAETELGAIDSLSGRWKVGAFRNLIANGLMRTEFKDRGPTDFALVPPLPEIQPATNEFLNEDDRRVAQMLARLGECAARRDPEAIRQMAQTDVNSPDELASLRTLAPVFGSCMEVGVTLKLTRDLMRDYAVLGYARLAYTLQTTEQASHDAEAKS